MICPAMSLPLQKVKCIGNKCAWWLEIGARRIPVKDCAVHAFPSLLEGALGKYTADLPPVTIPPLK